MRAERGRMSVLATRIRESDAKKRITKLREQFGGVEFEIVPGENGTVNLQMKGKIESRPLYDQMVEVANGN